MDVPEFSLILCVMIGLGVGIDYALFIVTRHRQHLHDGMSVEDAAGTANATAGQAVLFAGTTVVIAILGLFLAGLPAISAMGVGGRAGRTVSMAAAVTLLPGLLGLAGTKIDKLSIHRKTHVAKPAHETVSGRWAHHVGQHPVRYAAASLVALVRDRRARLQHADRHARRRQRPHRHDPAQAFDLLAEGFGPGLQRPHPGRRRARRPPATGGRGPRPRRPPGRPRGRRGHALRCSTPPATPRCSRPTRPRHRRTRRPTSSCATSAPTCSPPRSTAPTPRCSLTGQAMVTDLTDRITSRLPLFIVAVVALSFLLLMIVFRSILVPLKAAVMNLLSIGAAYGVVVAVFQWGWGKELIGLEQHDADQPVPPADDVRHPVRALDGLRGVPPVPGP